MSPPVGPTGLPESCGGGDGAWGIFASAGFVDTRLSFSKGANAGLDELSVAAALSWRTSRRWTLTGSAGALVAGDFTPSGGTGQTLRPGPFVALGATVRLLEGGDGKPFATASLAASALSSRVLTDAGSSAYFAADINATGIFGMTLGRLWSPYLGASVFGGPVLWGGGAAQTIGTDAYHYQVLLGLNVALPWQLVLFIQGSPVGERELSAGVGRSL